MNRKNLLFAAFLFAAVVAAICIIPSLHTPYDWMPDFSAQSEEPFGCKYFDQWLERDMPLGYEVLDEVPDSLNAATDAILYTKYILGRYVSGYDNHEQEVARARRLKAFAQAGGKVIVATTTIHRQSDSIFYAYGLRPDTVYDYGDFRNLYRVVDNRKKAQPEQLLKFGWRPDRTSYQLDSLLCLDADLSRSFNAKRHRRLLVQSDSLRRVLAFSRTYPSGGVIIFVSMPLLFSNYALMDRQAVQLSARLLRLVDDRHLVRIEGRNLPEQQSETSSRDLFAWLRTHPSLRTGFNLFLVVLVLAVLFLSRRRVRAVPLPPVVRNVTLDFARTMGTFHYRRRDFAAVLTEQFNVMCGDLGEVMPSGDGQPSLDEVKAAILQRTSMPQREVTHLIYVMKKVSADSGFELTQYDLMTLLDTIRQIKQKLKEEN